MERRATADCRRWRERSGKTRGSRLVGRSASGASAKADVAQLAERVLGKDEVTSSILVIGSITLARWRRTREQEGPKPKAQGPSRKKGT